MSITKERKFLMVSSAMRHLFTIQLNVFKNVMKKNVKFKGSVVGIIFGF